MNLPAIGSEVTVKTNYSYEGAPKTYTGKVTQYTKHFDTMFWMVITHIDGKEKPVGSYPNEVVDDIRNIIE